MVRRRQSHVANVKIHLTLYLQTVTNVYFMELGKSKLLEDGFALQSLRPLEPRIVSESLWFLPEVSHSLCLALSRLTNVSQPERGGGLKNILLRHHESGPFSRRCEGWATYEGERGQGQRKKKPCG